MNIRSHGASSRIEIPGSEVPADLAVDRGLPGQANVASDPGLPSEVTSSVQVQQQDAHHFTVRPGPALPDAALGAAAHAMARLVGPSELTGGDGSAEVVAANPVKEVTLRRAAHLVDQVVQFATQLKLHPRTTELLLDTLGRSVHLEDLNLLSAVNGLLADRAGTPAVSDLKLASLAAIFDTAGSPRAAQELQSLIERQAQARAMADTRYTPEAATRDIRTQLQGYLDETARKRSEMPDTLRYPD